MEKEEFLATCKATIELKDKHLDIVTEDFYTAIGIGWFPLLEDLCIILRALNQELKDTKFTDPLPTIELAKEKFGALRVHLTSYPNDDFTRAVEAVEERSRKVCEFCGKTGYLTTNGHWLKTCCDKCTEEKGRRRDEEAEKLFTEPILNWPLGPKEEGKND